MLKLDRRPLLLIVRDGWGHNPYPEWAHASAIHLAKKPNDDRFMAAYPHTLIHTSGEEVGLPAGVMGNSEVGHQNIGAGRVVDQEVMRITRTIREGSFFENPVLIGAVEHCKRTGRICPAVASSTRRPAAWVWDSRCSNRPSRRFRTSSSLSGRRAPCRKANSSRPASGAESA